jgi:hypothetical protein
MSATASSPVRRPGIEPLNCAKTLLLSPVEEILLIDSWLEVRVDAQIVPSAGTLSQTQVATQRAQWMISIVIHRALCIFATTFPLDICC